MDLFVCLNLLAKLLVLQLKKIDKAIIHSKILFCDEAFKKDDSISVLWNIAKYPCNIWYFQTPPERVKIAIKV